MNTYIEKAREFLTKGSFRKNVMVLFSGSVASQFVYLLFTPFLTRIYNPSDFGQYAIFITFLSIITLIITGQYELTFLLPKKERHFRHLVFGTVFLIIILSLLTVTLLLLFSPLLQSYKFFDNKGILLVLGVSVLINALYQTGIYMSLRKKAFKSISLINIINVVLSILFQILLSKTRLVGEGLVLGYMIGTLVAMLILFIKNIEVFKVKMKFRSVIRESKKLLYRYKEFPLFNMPATLVNLLANQAPMLLLNPFGSAIVGHFAMSQKVLGSPVSLFSTSVSYVFREEASRDYRNKGNCRPIFVKTFKTLFLMSIVPFLLLFIFSPILVPIIFGAGWEIAGIYIQALTLMYFFKFTVSPLSFVIIIAEKQKLNLILQTLLLIFTVFAISFGIYNKNPLTSITLYSIAYSIIYLIFLLICYKLAKNDKQNSCVAGEITK